MVWVSFLLIFLLGVAAGAAGVIGGGVYFLGWVTKKIDKKTLQLASDAASKTLIVKNNAPITDKSILVDPSNDDSSLDSSNDTQKDDWNASKSNPNQKSSSSALLGHQRLSSSPSLESLSDATSSSKQPAPTLTPRSRARSDITAITSSSPPLPIASSTPSPLTQSDPIPPVEQKRKEARKSRNLEISETRDDAFLLDSRSSKRSSVNAGDLVVMSTAPKAAKLLGDIAVSQKAAKLLGDDQDVLGHERVGDLIVGNGSRKLRRRSKTTTPADEAEKPKVTPSTSPVPSNTANTSSTGTSPAQPPTGASLPGSPAGSPQIPRHSSGSSISTADQLPTASRSGSSNFSNKETNTTTTTSTGHQRRKSSELSHASVVSSAAATLQRESSTSLSSKDKESKDKDLKEVTTSKSKDLRDTKESKSKDSKENDTPTTSSSKSSGSSTSLTLDGRSTSVTTGTAAPSAASSTKDGVSPTPELISPGHIPHDEPTLPANERFSLPPKDTISSRRNLEVQKTVPVRLIKREMYIKEARETANLDAQRRKLVIEIIEEFGLLEQVGNPSLFVRVIIGEQRYKSQHASRSGGRARWNEMLVARVDNPHLDMVEFEVLNRERLMLGRASMLLADLLKDCQKDVWLPMKGLADTGVKGSSKVSATGELHVSVVMVGWEELIALSKARGGASSSSSSTSNSNATSGSKSSKKDKGKDKDSDSSSSDDEKETSMNHRDSIQMPTPISSSMPSSSSPSTVNNDKFQTSSSKSPRQPESHGHPEHPIIHSQSQPLHLQSDHSQDHSYRDGPVSPHHVASSAFSTALSATAGTSDSSTHVTSLSSAHGPNTASNLTSTAGSSLSVGSAVASSRRSKGRPDSVSSSTPPIIGIPGSIGAAAGNSISAQITSSSTGTGLSSSDKSNRASAVMRSGAACATTPITTSSSDQFVPIPVYEGKNDVFVVGLQGWVNIKLTFKNTRWENRWCVVDGNLFRIYEDMYSQAPLGVLPIFGSQVWRLRTKRHHIKVQLAKDAGAQWESFILKPLPIPNVPESHHISPWFNHINRARKLSNDYIAHPPTCAAEAPAMISSDPSNLALNADNLDSSDDYFSEPSDNEDLDTSGSISGSTASTSTNASFTQSSAPPSFSSTTSSTSASTYNSKYGSTNTGTSTTHEKSIISPRSNTIADSTLDSSESSQSSSKSESGHRHRHHKRKSSDRSGSQSVEQRPSADRLPVSDHKPVLDHRQSMDVRPTTDRSDARVSIDSRSVSMDVRPSATSSTTTEKKLSSSQPAKPKTSSTTTNTSLGAPKTSNSGGSLPRQGSSLPQTQTSTSSSSTHPNPSDHPGPLNVHLTTVTSSGSVQVIDANVEPGKPNPSTGTKDDILYAFDSALPKEDELLEYIRKEQDDERRAYVLANLTPLKRIPEHIEGYDAGFLNLILWRMFRDMQTSELFAHDVREKIRAKIETTKLPPFLGNLRLLDIDWGRDFFKIETAKVVATEVQNEVIAELDVSYTGGLAVMLGIECYINWPRPKAAVIPVSSKIKLKSLRGKLHLCFPSELNTKNSLCFVVPPVVEFDVSIDVGHGQGRRVSSIPKLKQFLFSFARQAAFTALVHPSRIRWFWPIPGRKVDVELESLKDRAKEKKPTKGHTDILLRDTSDVIACKYVALEFFNHVLNQYRYERIDQLFSVDCIVHGTNYIDVPMRGRDGVLGWIIEIRKSFPDIRFFIDELNAAKTNISIQWTARGTFKSDLWDYPATQQEMLLRGVFALKVRDGNQLVTEFFVYWSLGTIYGLV